MASAWEVISSLCGWIYFFAWSLSFYPQPLMNLQRRATTGLVADFPLMNVFGFTCYTISTAAFLYSPVIRQEYAARHPHSPSPTVRFNDLAFGVHATILCIITISQFSSKLWGFRPSDTRFRPSSVSLGILFGSVAGVVVVLFLVLAHLNNDAQQHNPWGWHWIDLIYSLTYIKLLLTIFKYIPQVMENYRRKSTSGWATSAMVMDLVGGVLSLAQLVIDASLQADWSGLTGNPVKFGLANISLLFDAIFVVQHFILYGAVEVDHKGLADGDEGRPATETDPLLR